MEPVAPARRCLQVERPAPRINPDILRRYDLRGIVGRQLGLGDARALGLAYAECARREARNRIAVGRDGRLSSPELERALIEGLTAGGMHVHRIGIGPTPQLYFAVHSRALDGGIMVTGSHNPPQENGFKVLLGAAPVHGEHLRELVETAGARAPGGRITEMPCSAEYVQALAAVRELKPLTVIWDCGNGATGGIVRALTARLPGRHYLLNSRIDGRFPAHHPDPAVAGNLRELQVAVLSHGADLGIAFDGDGDRIGVVDESGAILWPDQVMVLLARALLREQPGASVVADVKSSRVLFEEIERSGGRAVMAPSGYVRVRDVMLRESAPLAGEMSGHILYRDCWHGTDDALYVAMRLLEALAATTNSLGDFRRALPRSASTPELRVPCPEAAKERIVREVLARLRAAGAEVDTTDGLRVHSGSGWWLLRASGTESRLTIRCEADDEDSLDELRREVRRQLAQSGLDCGLGEHPHRRSAAHAGVPAH